jgi:hypothetical protein
LARRYSRRRILEKIDFLRYVQETTPAKIKKPRGWLRRAIEENYSAPDGYKSQQQRAAEAAGEAFQPQALVSPPGEQNQEPDERREEEEPKPTDRLAQLQAQYGTTQRELDLWLQVLKELKLSLTRVTFSAWFPQTHLLKLEEGVAVISVPNKAAQEWLSQRLAGLILRIMSGIVEQPIAELRCEVVM